IFVHTPATTVLYTLSLHDALPISLPQACEKTARRRERRPALRPRLDRLRPTHAYVVVARLCDRGGGPADARGDRRTRRDRDHRPQRLRRRARGARRNDEPDGDPG